MRSQVRGQSPVRRSLVALPLLYALTCVPTASNLPKRFRERGLRLPAGKVARSQGPEADSLADRAAETCGALSPGSETRLPCELLRNGVSGCMPDSTFVMVSLTLIKSKVRDWSRGRPLRRMLLLLSYSRVRDISQHLMFCGRRVAPQPTKHMGLGPQLGVAAGAVHGSNHVRARLHVVAPHGVWSRHALGGRPRCGRARRCALLPCASRRARFEQAFPVRRWEGCFRTTNQPLARLSDGVLCSLSHLHLCGCLVRRRPNCCDKRSYERGSERGKCGQLQPWSGAACEAAHEAYMAAPLHAIGWSRCGSCGILVPSLPSACRSCAQWDMPVLP